MPPPFLQHIQYSRVGMSIAPLSLVGHGRKIHSLELPFFGSDLSDVRIVYELHGSSLGLVLR